MKLSDHSLKQLDEAYLKRLEESSLRALSVTLLADLKEARDRLNQSSQNSSRPPSQDAPWEKGDRRKNPTVPQDEANSDTGQPDEVASNEAEQSQPSAPLPADKEASGKAPPVRRKAGKVPGAPGYGRAAPDKVDVTEIHAPSCCAGCGRSLAERIHQDYNGHYEVDFVREATGWAVVHRKHVWREADCGCGHITRAEPARRVEEGVMVGGFRLIGPGLAALVVALALRYRLSRARIAEFLDEWLGVKISVGCLQEAIEEAGILLAPVEDQLVTAIQQSGVLYADETPWPEQHARKLSLWLWVFTAAKVTLYYVSHRGQELVKNLLDDYAGVLMSDGWQAYRVYKKRLRCWAHLKRKAVGLTESFDAEARAFGHAALDLWRILRDAVRQARIEPKPPPLRTVFDEHLQAFRRQCEAAKDSPHEKTRALAREFLQDWEAIFAVLDDPSLPLTNNAAERSLRHWVILRKLTHGSRTERGSRGFALLASIIDTCRQRGHSPWEFLSNSIARRRQNLEVLVLPV